MPGTIADAATKAAKTAMRPRSVAVHRLREELRSTEAEVPEVLRDLDDGIRDRYGVLCPFPTDEEERYFQIERALERRMPGEWRNAKIGCIMADGAAVLRDVLSHLTATT